MIRRFLLWLVKPYMKDPDLRDFMVNMPENYTPADQYRDFIKVFNTDEGKRVLTKILIWGKVSAGNYHSGMSALDLAFKEGERNMVLRIVGALTPPMAIEKPTEQRRRVQ